MDAALSIAAPASAAFPAAGVATAETDGEGGFAAALTRSLAAAVEAGSASTASVTPATIAPAISVVQTPPTATPAAVPTVPTPGTAAAVPEGHPGCHLSCADARRDARAATARDAAGHDRNRRPSPTNLPRTSRRWRKNATRSSRPPARPCSAALPSMISAPTQPARPQTSTKATVSSSDEGGDEPARQSPPRAAAVLPSAPPPANAPVAVSNGAPKTACALARAAWRPSLRPCAGGGSHGHGAAVRRSGPS
jgi:hypothetical protein